MAIPHLDPLISGTGKSENDDSVSGDFVDVGVPVFDDVASAGRADRQRSESSEAQEARASYTSRDTTPRDYAQENARKTSKLENDIAEFYAGLGLLLMAFSPQDAVIVINCAPQRAKELAEIAKHNPGFARFLRRMMTGNAYSVAILGHASMIMAIMANHGVTPGTIMERMRKPPQLTHSQGQANAPKDSPVTGIPVPPEKPLTPAERAAVEQILQMGGQFPPAGPIPTADESIPNPGAIGLDQRR